MQSVKVKEYIKLLTHITNISINLNIILDTYFANKINYDNHIVQQKKMLPITDKFAIPIYMQHIF